MPLAVKLSSIVLHVAVAFPRLYVSLSAMVMVACMEQQFGDANLPQAAVAAGPCNLVVVVSHKQHHLVVADQSLTSLRVPHKPVLN